MTPKKAGSGKTNGSVETGTEKSSDDSPQSASTETNSGPKAKAPVKVQPPQKPTTDPRYRPTNLPFGEPVPLTRPPIMIGLSTLIVLLTVCLAVLGLVPVTTQTSAPGIAISGGRFLPIVANEPGQILSIDVKAGDKVSVGQPIATLDISDTSPPIELRSQWDGTVAEVKATRGSVVEAQTEIALVVESAKPLEVIGFFGVDDAATVSVGDVARIYTSGSSQNDSTYIPGTVSGIEQSVDSPNAITAITGGSEIGREVKDQGAVQVVRISPESPEGEPLASGQTLTVDVITGEERLFSLFGNG